MGRIFILGGEDANGLNGGGGDDRIVGDRAGDTMNGGPGDDTTVWNNGDGSDVMNGDEGRDVVEVNGSPTGADTFTVQPNGARIKFDRTSAGPFTLDIGAAEAMALNSLGGDDTIIVGEVGAFFVLAQGGSGNDSLNGAGGAETFLGGSGNDFLAPGRDSMWHTVPRATTPSSSVTASSTSRAAARARIRSAPTRSLSTVRWTAVRRSTGRPWSTPRRNRSQSAGGR